MSGLIAEFGTGQVLWSMIWFFLFFIWIYLLIVVFSDIFRSDDLGGGSKAVWTIFVIVLPYLGVFVYLLARGHKMQEHMVHAARSDAERVAAHYSWDRAARQVLQLTDAAAGQAPTMGCP